ncbi:MAG TPA: phosphoribosyl-ATP diphosphatase [Afipia sp.]
MSDSLERLCKAVEAARGLDPAVSRTARLLRRGPAKMAKKLAEEAIEVAIDAVGGKREDVVRESADLLYNLSVLWVGLGIKPQDVWDEMDRRERDFGIAEKLPKLPLKPPLNKKPDLKVAVAKVAAVGRVSRRPIAAQRTAAKPR